MRLLWWKPKPISAIRAQIVRQAQRRESLADYKRWVDEMVNRPESLRKAREHAPSRTVKRNRPKDES